MPQLLLFAPCEKVAYAQDGAACLIGILQGFEILLREDYKEKNEEALEKSEKFQLPIKWTIFTMWRLKKDEVGKLFEQSCKLIGPSGRISFEQALEFGKEPVEHQRNTMQVFGFPLKEEGEYILTLEIGESGKQRVKVATYPITVSHRMDSPISSE